MRRVASIGPVSISTGSTPTRHWSTTRARGRRPSSRARAAVVIKHRGRTVGDLRRAAGGVHAVLARDRLQLRERLERRLPQPFVARDVVRRARRLAFLVDVGRVDREHLAFEATLGPRPLRALLRLEPERVGVGAGDAPLLGDALGAFELRSSARSARGTRVGWAGRSRRAPRHRAGPGSSTRCRTTSATSTTPDPIIDAARLVACCDDPHWLSTVVAATSSGSPALSQAVRAMLNVCSPTWLTQPPMT